MHARYVVLGALLAASVASAQPTGPHRQAPAELVENAGARVGELIPDLTYREIDGVERRLSDAMGENGLVVVMRSVDCPVGRRYGLTLKRLEAEYEPRGLSFLYVNASTQDSLESIRAEIERFRFTGDYVHEASEPTLAAGLGVMTTTEVFLLDRARTLRYRGAIDDQYGIGYSKPAPTRHYLADAIDGLLAGERIAVEATTAPGCVLGLTSSGENHSHDGPVTYHNHVSRIVQRNCETCHRPGGAGPFSLERYEQVKGFSSMIRYVVEHETMPPWFADGSGHWANDRALSSRERDALLGWVDEGAPEGDPKDAPVAMNWTDGWAIPEPDAVVQIPEPFDVPAQGVVDYEYVYVKTDFPEDRWVQQMEIRPTAPQVTHHVLVFLEEPGRKGARDKRRKPGEPVFQGGLQGYFASTVPGQQPTRYPEGMAKRLPKGAWLKFQLHYTPNGEPAADQTKLGFVFAEEPPRYTVGTGAAFDTRFEIPPGAPNHEVPATFQFERDIMLMSFFPHMHTRGKAFRYELVYPDGRREMLLNIPRYDFNWQLIYELKDPILVPAGTLIRSTGWFDNSADNPANPDPTDAVRFGEQTFEEMMIGYFDWYDPNAPR